MARIGLCFDLKETWRQRGLSEEAVAEFDDRDVIDALAAALRRLGHDVREVGGARELAAALVQGTRFDGVFSICEGLEGRAREAQVPALCDAFGVPQVFSDATAIAVMHDKALAKRIVRDHGLPTAPFAVLHRPDDADGVTLPFPVFAKPVAEGSSKGVTPASRAADRAALARIAGDLIARFRQPVLVETYLPGPEVTVGLTGTGASAEAIGALEIIMTAEADSAFYSYANKEEWEARMTYRLADGALGAEAKAVALACWRALEGRDAGRIDLRADAAGRLMFLEANPLAGLHPVKSDIVITARLAGVDYDGLIARIMASAAARDPAFAARPA